MPTGNGETPEFTFTGHLINDEEKTKKEIQIHIDNIENIDITIEL